MFVLGGLTLIKYFVLFSGRIPPSCVHLVLSLLFMFSMFSYSNSQSGLH